MCSNKEQPRIDLTLLQDCFHSFPNLHHALVEGTWKYWCSPKENNQARRSAFSQVHPTAALLQEKQQHDVDMWVTKRFYMVEDEQSHHTAPSKESQQKERQMKQTDKMENIECLKKNSKMLLREG